MDFDLRNRCENSFDEDIWAILIPFQVQNSYTTQFSDICGNIDMWKIAILFNLLAGYDKTH